VPFLARSPNPVDDAEQVIRVRDGVERDGEVRRSRLVEVRAAVAMAAMAGNGPAKQSAHLDPEWRVVLLSSSARSG
jgi:hypothetical protein